MQRSQPSIDLQFATIAGVVLAIIVYGSLFPFDFHANANPAGPFGQLIASARQRPGRGDLIANILLYIPLGLFAVLALCRRPRFGWVTLVILAGCALSTGIELTQFYDRGRVTALSDVYANTAGTGIGVLGGVILHGKSRLLAIGDAKKHPFVFLLLACWLGYRLFPYVPVIDLHKYWHAVKPVLFAARLPIVDLYRHTAIWLVIALLFETLAGIKWGRLVFLLFIPAVLFARILIVGIELSRVEVAGGVIAALAWAGLLWRLPIRAVLIAVMFAGVVVVQGLEPFHFSPAARPFEWIPFRSFMQGSIATNVASFFEKAFTYGALIWLFRRAGGSLRTATLLGAGLVGCLRFGQIYIPGRSAEITDLVMLIILAAIMKAMRENPSVYQLSD